uniref:Uncharacterized protein n=1 Tax=Anguilla anguilla TaxID=7936 RepID=A0A0E9VSS0_ANGAN
MFSLVTKRHKYCRNRLKTMKGLPSTKGMNGLGDGGPCVAFCGFLMEIKAVSYMFGLM